jgi:long-subunit acyl-CoA synthetase (AMP-forming)
MFQRVTTVAFYDTLGPEATKYCVDQTQVTTIACTIDCVTKLAQLKKDEAGTGVDKMRTLDNIIVFGFDNE